MKQIPHFNSSNFDDIRAYKDDEVQSVLLRLIQDNELMCKLLSFKMPGVIPGFILSLMIPLIKMRLKMMIKGIYSIRSFQNRFVRGYVEKCIKDTVDSLEVFGLDNLPNEQRFLFLSTHRDIVLDPVLVNFFFVRRFPTMYVATGNNLFKPDIVSDLMRLNKSFIVKRGDVGSVRDKYNALVQLSQHIHSLREHNESAWIAQREGRSKDGYDKTSDSLLKMLHVARKSESSLAETVRLLNITPVAISYEYDPCDVFKANELWHLEKYKIYNKKNDEDLQSILTGINGYKGRVRVSFGKPLDVGDDIMLAQLTEQVDIEVAKIYHLMPTHIAAYRYICNLNGSEDLYEYLPDTFKIPKKTQEVALENLIKRAEALDNAEKRIVMLKMYANSVHSWIDRCLKK